jgi:D-isomer specific 2-hydroxyacid dehydrogenase, NAD binding domain
MSRDRTGWLATSDFVVIAAPYTPQTAKMFRRAQFQEMKKTAYLINIGRGVGRFRSGPRAIWISHPVVNATALQRAWTMDTSQTPPAERVA